MKQRIVYVHHTVSSPFSLDAEEGIFIPVFRTSGVEAQGVEHAVSDHYVERGEMVCRVCAAECECTRFIGMELVAVAQFAPWSRNRWGYHSANEDVSIVMYPCGCPIVQDKIRGNDFGICIYYQHPFFSAFVYKSVSIPRPSGILVVEFIYAMRESLNGRIAGYAFDVRAMIVAHKNLVFEIAILVFHFFALFLKFADKFATVEIVCRYDNADHEVRNKTFSVTAGWGAGCNLGEGGIMFR